MAIRLGRAFKVTFLRSSIIRTIFLSYLSTNLLLILGLGLLTIRDSTAMFTAQIVSSSQKVMEETTIGLNFNLEEVKRALVLMGTNPSVITLLGSRSLSTEETINHERIVTDASRSISSAIISDILMVGANGYVNNLDGRKTLRWDYAFNEQTWFRKSIAAESSDFIPLGIHKQDYYLDSYAAKYIQPTFSVALPMFNHDQQIIGSLICNIDISRINAMFDLSAYEYSSTLFMVDEEDHIIAHKNKDLIGTPFRLESGPSAESGSFIAPVEGRESLIIKHPTSIGYWKLISVIPMTEITKHSRQLERNLTRILYLCLAVNILIAIAITVKISRPVRRLLRTLDSTASEHLIVRKQDYRYAELNQIGQKFAELMDRIKLLIRQNYVSQIKLKETEIKALQSQINPHFLFNTLQLLQTEIVYGNNEESNQLVVSLSSLLRYSMNQAQEIVTLGQELSYTKDYLYILNKKFDGQLKAQYRVGNAGLLSCKTLKLLLQPIVENCIKHGFREHPNDSQIRISVTEVRRGVLVAVEDNGVGIGKKKLRRLRELIGRPPLQNESNVGLHNVNQRIKLSYGEAYGIYIRSKENAYTKVYAVLPRVE